MPIYFRCRHCRARLSITRRKAGMSVACPRCQQQVRVPTLDKQSRTAATDPAPAVSEGSDPSTALDDDELLNGREQTAVSAAPFATQPLPNSGMPPPPFPMSSSAGASAHPSAPLTPPPIPPAPYQHSRPLAAPAPSSPSTGFAYSMPSPTTNRKKTVQGRTASTEPPLFEKDIDALLDSLPESPPLRRRSSQSTIGVDAAMLDQRQPPSEQAQRITAIIVIAFTFVVLAFLAGLFIAMR